VVTLARTRAIVLATTISVAATSASATADGQPPDPPKLRADDVVSESLKRGEAYAHLIAAGLASLLGVGLALLKASTEIGTTQALITAVAVVILVFVL